MSKISRNVLVTMLTQFIMQLANFIGRSIFIRVLGIECQGVASVCMNIIQILSIAELGFGSALSYSLYGPIANGDHQKVRNYIKAAERFFLFISIIVFIVGSGIAFILPIFIESKMSNWLISFYMIVYILSLSLTLLINAKTVLITSDQKTYIVNGINNIADILKVIIQCAVLLLFHQLSLFLVIELIAIIGKLVLFITYTSTNYRWLQEDRTESLLENEKNELKKNTLAMFMHKVGSIAVNGTDNIIIAKIMTVSIAGVYSNYFLFLNAIQNLTLRIFSSITSVIGVTSIRKTKEEIEQIYNMYLFINFFLISVITAVLLPNINVLIGLWIGQDYLLGEKEVIVLICSFYITGMRKVNLVFRDALGVYWHDRYKAIAEAVINLIFSIILAKYYGVQGVILGTIISSITTVVWVEPYIIYKYAFKNFSHIHYYIKRHISFLIATIAGTVISNHICINMSSTFTSLMIRAILSMMIMCFINIIMFFRTSEFIAVRERLFKYFLYKR